MTMTEQQQGRPLTVDHFKAMLLKEATSLVAAIRPALSERGERQDDKKIGDNQWRSLVSACQEATVLDEIKALIEYKIGKDAEVKEPQRPQGWARPVAAGKTAGQVTLEHLERVAQAVQGAGGDMILSLKVAALFFGYVAWRVKADRARQGGGQP